MPAFGKRGILLVGEFPGADENMQGKPFVGKAGELLKSELAIAGMSINECRCTNMWLHNKNDECDVDWHISQLMDEIKQSHHVLLMGSDVVKQLLGKSVMALSGLEVKPEWAKTARVFVSPNPAQMFYSPIGEFRLALTRFVEAVRSDEK